MLATADSPHSLDSDPSIAFEPFSRASVFSKRHVTGLFHGLYAAKQGRAHIERGLEPWVAYLYLVPPPIEAVPSHADLDEGLRSEHVDKSLRRHNLSSWR